MQTMLQHLMNHGQDQVTYVLFRALKDLTCVSSACPCDVDAANGWNPTDIFVRTYAKK
jgi:aminomethyltransferase